VVRAGLRGSALGGRSAMSQQGVRLQRRLGCRVLLPECSGPCSAVGKKRGKETERRGCAAKPWRDPGGSAAAGGEGAGCRCRPGEASPCAPGPRAASALGSARCDGARRQHRDVQQGTGARVTLSAQSRARMPFCKTLYEQNTERV